jgi:hypothetical protein
VVLVTLTALLLLSSLPGVATLLLQLALSKSSTLAAWYVWSPPG